ncbi:MAG: M48 family metallopeptidase [Planctomycetota bacterium]
MSPGLIDAVYHRPGHASARVTLHIEPAAHVLIVRGDGFEQRVPTPRLAVSDGGWRGGALHLTWTEGGPGAGAQTGAASVTVDDPAALAALRMALPRDLAATAQALQDLAGRRRRRNHVLLVVLLLVLALPVVLIGALVVYPDPVIDFAAARVPLSVDRSIGRQFERGLAPGSRVQDDVIAPALEQIGQRLLAAAPPETAAEALNFRFVALRDASVNAFAAPGGLVVVHTGLLAAASSPEEVAGVMAHEIAHVLERHSMRQLCYRVGLWSSLSLTLGGAGGGLGSIAGAATELTDLGFSRDQERDADRLGVEILQRAGIATEGLAAFFARLAEQGGALPALLSTHPSSDDRAEALRALAARDDATPPLRPIAIDWSRVQDAARGG